MNDDTPKPTSETSSAGSAPPPLPPPQSQIPRPKKSGGVPVGLGIVLGVLMLIGGTCLNLFPDDGKDQAMEMALGKILLAGGATLAVGGIFVLVAEKKYRHQAEVVHTGKIHTPKWVYVFSGACLLLPVTIGVMAVMFRVGGNINLFIAGGCGGVGASMCVAFSRNLSLTVPRRIYACILTTGFTYMVFFAVNDQVVAALHPSK